MILYNNREVKFGLFPNGESYLPKIRINPEDTTHVVTLKYDDDVDLFRLLLVKQELRDVQEPVALRITYVPYSRMDRDNGVYTFTLQALAYYINWMDWDEVIIYEPHSDVLPALLERVTVVNVTASPIMQAKINTAFGTTDYQVFYPDAGAQKRYSGLESGSPSLDKWRSETELIGFKTRDFETGKITSAHVVGERKSDNVVILDDLCSKGGTFILAATKLKEMGFKIILAVAHCENTIFEGSIFTSGLISKVITTDSILAPTYVTGYSEAGISNMLKVIPLRI